MKSTDDQGLIPVIVASEADSTYIRAIPTAQPAAGDGSVSLELGLPPECAIAVAAGGKRPQEKDMNGIWNLFSRAIQSLQAYRGVYSASFATAIGGYPKYALVSDGSGNFWVSAADQNTTTPGESGAFWSSLFSGYATESWVNGEFQPLGDYIKTLPSDGTYAPVLSVQHNNKDGTLGVRYGDDGSGWATYQPSGATAGAITGGTYTKTPMNDGTGRSVLRQQFTVNNPSGLGFISFPISYTQNPVVSISSTDNRSNSYSVIANIRHDTVTTSGFTLFAAWYAGQLSGVADSATITVIVEGISS